MDEFIWVGKIVNTLGIKVSLKDKVEYNGKLVKPKKEKIYILLNKPVGYVTTAYDEFSRKTVLDLVNINERVVPVGRLDMNTSGALLLSNDGDFIYKVTHPKYEIEKTYIATVNGIVEKEEINNLRNGVQIEDYVVKPKVKIIKKDIEKKNTVLQIIIHEGKNREVRKMCEKIGHKVIKLHRSKIGNLEVSNLKFGQWRYLEKKEIDLQLNY